MALILGGMKYHNTDAATFRAWISQITVYLQVAGWLQSSDTGQINLATVAAPTTPSEVMGYQIWKMNDSLQSAAPVFLKIEYGSAAAGALIPQLWFTLGTGSNGTGTVTGSPLGTRRTFTPGAANTDTETVIGSGDGSRFVLGIDMDTGSRDTSTVCFSFERTRDANGAISADGVMAWVYETITTPHYTSYLYIFGAPETSEAGLACFLPSVGSGAGNGNVGYFPVLFTNGGIYLPASVNALGSFEANVTMYGFTMVNLYTQQIRWYVSHLPNPARGTTGAAALLMIRFD